MINVRKFKNDLAVVLATLMIFTMLPGGLLKVKAVDSEKTTLDISNGSIVFGDGTVTQNGESCIYNSNGYIITQSVSSATTNTIRITGGSQNITLNGVSIDKASTGGGCAFFVASGATVNLTLRGSNTLDSGMNCAGLNIPVGASVTISGNAGDSLKATGGPYAAGIGGGISESCGSLTITGGVIEADCYYNSAGIGGGGNGGTSGNNCNGGNGGTVTITGGTVTAKGNRAAGIGGGGSGGAGIDGNGGKVIITGGVITAIGGVCGAGIGGGGKSGNGGMVDISGGTVVATGGAGGIGAGNGFSGNDKGTCTITGGSVYATELRHHTMSVKTTVTDGISTEHCVTMSGLTANTDTKCSVNGGNTFSSKTDSDGKLYIWLPEGDDKTVICCNSTYYALNISGLASNITSALTDNNKMTILDISKSSITISDSSVTGKDKYGNNSVINSNGYMIVGTSTSNTVTVSGGTHSIVLEGADIKPKSGCAFSLSSGTVYLTLSGDNILTSGGYDYHAGLEVPDGTSISITGTDADSLKAAGINSGAGIGGDGNSSGTGTIAICGGTVTAKGSYYGGAGIGGGWMQSGGTIAISGGTVNATGGSGGAGIGGGADFSGGTVTISGGTVNATGDSGGAGIGGGDGFSGGTVTISGGTVTAKVTDNYNKIKFLGAGIGGGYNSTGSTGIVITGGSVKAASISGTPTSDGTTKVYLVTVTLLSGTDINSLSVTQGSTVTYGIKNIQADDSEMLYLYLPAYAGDTKVNVTADGTTYSSYHGTVGTSGTNALKMDQSPLSFVAAATQAFIYGDTIDLDKTVSGGTLSGTTSYTYSGTDKKGNAISDSTECPTNAGDDYTVTATLPGNTCYYDATATKHFTINQKNINTDGVSIGVTSAVYSGKALFPGITATFGSNTLGSGTDFDVYDGTGSTENPTYTNAGSYNILMKGTGNYTGSRPETFTIAQKAIALTLTASQNSAKAGGTVTLTATVLNVVDLPAGLVTFKYDDIAIQSETEITESDGKYTATATWNNVPAGEHTLTAEYVPVANDNYSCSAKAEIGNYSITKYDQTGFCFSDDSITKTYGDGAFTVTASGGHGTGNVTYKSSDDNVAIVDADLGLVTIKKAGTVTITAKKDSDFTYNEAADAIIVNIGKAAPSIKTIPTASGIAVIGKLSSSTLTGGKCSVTGSFGWANLDTIVSKSGEYEVSFTPSDLTNYSTCTCKVKVNVTPVITNSNTGVQYDLTNTNLPHEVTSVSVQSFTISETGPESSAYSVVNKLINSSTSSASPSAVKLYNLSLMDQNKQAITGFTGKITVRIPIPDGMNGGLHVYWYNDADGTVTDMNAKQENGYLVFETTHFSYYAVAVLTAKSSSGSGTIPNPNTGSDSFPSVLVALLGISVCGLVVVTRGKRFRKKS